MLKFVESSILGVEDFFCSIRVGFESLSVRLGTTVMERRIGDVIIDFCCSESSP